MKKYYIIILFIILAIIPTSFAALKVQNSLGQEISSLNFDILGGTSRSFNFSVCSVGENTSYISFYNFSQFLNPIQPNNISNLKQNDCMQMNLSTTVGNTSISKLYDEKIIILSPNESKSLDIYLNVIENTIWNLTIQDYNLTLKKGDYGIFNFSIKNNGNVDVNLRETFVMNNNNSLLVTDLKEFTIPINQTFNKPIFYDIFWNTTPGLYSYNLTFFDNTSSSKMFSIRLNVTDIYPPVIDSYSVFPESADMGQIIVISVSTNDDTGISRVYSDIFDGANFSLFGNNTYKLFFNKTDYPSNKIYNVTVIDKFGNKAIKEFRIEIRPDYIISAPKEAYFSKIQAKGEREIKLLSTNKTTFLAFSLKEFTTENPNSSLSLWINGKALNITSSVIIDNAYGDIMLKVRQNIQYKTKIDEKTNLTSIVEDTEMNSYITGFRGSIDVVTDSKVINPQPNIRFSGKYDLYSVSPATSIVIPYFTNGAFPPNFTCVPLDTGIYDTSKYKCSVDYPVDIKERDLAVVGTLSSIDNMKSGYETNLSYLNLEYNTEKSGKWTLIYSFIIIIVIFLIYWFVLRTATVV